MRHAADVLQALGHPIRLQILESLRRGPATVGVIVGRLALEQPVVSRHLAILRHAGVVMVEPDGRERIYRTTGEADALLGVLFTRKRGSA